MVEGEEEAFCRICFEDGGKDLIQPCKCTGAQRGACSWAAPAPTPTCLPSSATHQSFGVRSCRSPTLRCPAAGSQAHVHASCLRRWQETVRCNAKGLAKRDGAACSQRAVLCTVPGHQMQALAGARVSSPAKGPGALAGGPAASSSASSGRRLRDLGCADAQPAQRARPSAACAGACSRSSRPRCPCASWPGSS